MKNLFNYTGENKNEISFPVGGIGTGCIGIAGNGRLIDWEIFNKPNKGSYNQFSHLAIKCEKDGKLLNAKVLNSNLSGSFQGSFTRDVWEGSFGWGPELYTMAGFPHFDELDFHGCYPFAELSFKDAAFPGKVSLNAFNPIIPLDSFNSSLPACFFEIEIENTNNFDANYTLGFSLHNPYQTVKKIEKDGYKGVFFDSSNEVSKDSLEYGNMTLLTQDAGVNIQEHWFRGEWFDAQTIYWNEFSALDSMPDRKYTKETKQFDNNHSTITVSSKVKKGEKKKIKFLLSWSSPNLKNYWHWGITLDDPENIAWKNYYATQFNTSLDSALYCVKNWDNLESRTHKFINTILESDLPKECTEAVISNLSILKSPTLLRLENGELYGFEGVAAKTGVCDGSCTHVWNYVYTVPFLFPDLARSMRTLDYKYNLQPDGSMPFRLRLPLGSTQKEFFPCADGTFGNVLKAYMDWKISGDTKWLKSIWPAIKKSVEFAWSNENFDYWDPEKKGVLTGRQHHTLDTELFGANSWLTGFYLGALKAGSQMAKHLNDYETATEWEELFEKGSKWVNKNLFNQEYFHQKVNLKDKTQLKKYENTWQHDNPRTTIYNKYWNSEAEELKYQIQDGCEIQQVIAQWHANISGLGQIFDKPKVKTALKSLFKNNFISKISDYANFCRNYCLNNEGGLIIATWKNDVYRPVVPLPYESETQNGYEYQALIHMIQEGLVSQGVKGIKAIRNRYNGKHRNPWNEFECGSNYARSMASFSIISAFSGFEFDMVKGYIGFKPIKTAKNKNSLNKEISYFWSVGSAWGKVSINKKTVQLSVIEGKISLNSFGLPCGKVINFEKTITINSNQTKEFS